MYCGVYKDSSVHVLQSNAIIDLLDDFTERWNAITFFGSPKKKKKDRIEVSWFFPLIMYFYFVRNGQTISNTNTNRYLPDSFRFNKTWAWIWYSVTYERMICLAWDHLAVPCSFLIGIYINFKCFSLIFFPQVWANNAMVQFPLGFSHSRHWFKLYFFMHFNGLLLCFCCCD